MTIHQILWNGRGTPESILWIQLGVPKSIRSRSEGAIGGRYGSPPPIRERSAYNPTPGRLWSAWWAPQRRPETFTRGTRTLQSGLSADWQGRSYGFSSARRSRSDGDPQNSSDRATEPARQSFGPSSAFRSSIRCCQWKHSRTHLGTPSSVRRRKGALLALFSGFTGSILRASLPPHCHHIEAARVSTRERLSRSERRSSSRPAPELRKALAPARFRASQSHLHAR